MRRQKRRDLERHEQHRNPDFDTVSLGDGSMRSDSFTVRIGKLEAAVTNNKRLRWRYCTVEPNYTVFQKKFTPRTFMITV